MTDKKNEEKEILLNDSLTVKDDSPSIDETGIVEETEAIEHAETMLDEAADEVPEVVLDADVITEESVSSEADLDKTLEMTPPRGQATKPEEPMKKKKKGKRHWTTYVFVIVGVLVIIPSLIVGAIVLQASLGQGKPVEGERFSGDLDPAISDDQIAQIQTEIETLELAEKVEVHLISATLRVNVQTPETITSDQFASLMETLYTKVTTVLPVADYFQVKPEVGRQQYDLEINAYNLDPKLVNEDTEGTLDAKYIYFSLVKSSLMEEVNVQEVSVPQDAEQAEYLRQRVQERIDWLQEQENGTQDSGSSDGEGA